MILFGLHNISVYPNSELRLDPAVRCQGEKIHVAAFIRLQIFNEKRVSVSLAGFSFCKRVLDEGVTS